MLQISQRAPQDAEATTIPDEASTTEPVTALELAKTPETAELVEGADETETDDVVDGVEDIPFAYGPNAAPWRTWIPRARPGFDQQL